MKKCQNCSLYYNDNAIKCTQCGAELVNENPQSPPPPNYNYYANPYIPQQKYCQLCGNLCDINASVCLKCGATFQGSPFERDEPSTILKIFSFFIPIIGLILYLIDSDKKPVSAKAYAKWALIGFIVNLSLQILIWVLYFLLMVIGIGYSL